MAFPEDVADWIAGEIDVIGLGTDASTEVTGGAYARLAPTYGAAAAGVADLTADLEFDGPANGGPVTHLRWYRTGGAFWFTAAVDVARSFNSDGRLDVSSAAIEVA